MTPKDYSEDSENLYYNEQNKKKKKELQQKFGMSDFHDKEKAPPKVINDFLNYTEQYETAYENAEEKTIREIMKFPEFRKLEEIPKDQMADEIEKVLEKYDEFSIHIGVVEEEDVDEKDFYRFLTEELQEHLTYHMEVPGMKANFIYEEFHPNQKLNMKDTSRYITEGIKSKDKGHIEIWLAEDNITLNNSVYNRDDFTANLFNIFPDNIVDTQLNYTEINVNDLNAQLEFTVNYKSDEKIIPQKYIMNFAFNKIDEDHMEVRSLEINKG